MLRYKIGGFLQSADMVFGRNVCLEPLVDQASELQHSLKESVDEGCALHERVDLKSALKADNVAAHTQIQADVARVVAHALSKQATFRDAHRAATT